MDALTSSMQAAGDAIASAVAAGRPEAGSRTRYGTVAANNGSTLDVDMSGGTLAALPMTTACAAARAGDRVMLDVAGPLMTAVGVIAGAGNVPYVSEVDGWLVAAFAGVAIVGRDLTTSSANKYYWTATAKWPVTFAARPYISVTPIYSGHSSNEYSMSLDLVGSSATDFRAYVGAGGKMDTSMQKGGVSVLAFGRLA